MSVKNRAIVQVLLIIVLLLGGYGVHTWFSHQKIKEDAYRAFHLRLESLCKTVLDGHVTTYLQAVEQLQDDPAVIDAFARRDRASLLEAAAPHYQRLLKFHPDTLKVFHFYRPDNVSFLRMHKPSMYGDDVSDHRPIVVAVNKEGKTLTGFEPGRFGFYYRVEIPVRYRGERIGMMDVGLKLEGILAQIREFFPNRTAVLMRKELADPLLSKEGLVPLDGYYIYSGDKDFFQNVTADMLTDDHSCPASMEDQHAVLHALDLKSFDGQVLGKFLVAQDVSELDRGLHAQLLSLAGALILIFIAIFFVLQAGFGSMLRRLEEAHDQLAYSEKYLQTILDAQGNMVIVTDGHRLKDANPAFFRYFPQYPSEEAFVVEHRCICDLFLPGEGYLQKEMAGQPWADYMLERPDTVHKAKMTVRGEEAVFSLTIQRMENCGTNLDVVTFTDITELEAYRRSLEERVEEELARRKEQEKLLIQQSRLAAMGEMIGNIAHQWRQPLNALSLLIQDIQDAYDYGELDEAYLRNTINTTTRTVERMSTTIDDFRNFFRPDKERQRFSVKKAVEEALEVVDAALLSKEIKVVLDLENGGEIQGFPNEYAQVLLNLINNGKDVLATKGGERNITITARRDEKDRSVVTVRDNGGGIPEEILGKVFDPYFTTKHKAEGTGVGLYMSKMIIEQNMGGTIRVENDGEGAVFTVIV